MRCCNVSEYDLTCKGAYIGTGNQQPMLQVAMSYGYDVTGQKCIRKCV